MENHHFWWVNQLQITIFNSYVCFCICFIRIFGCNPVKKSPWFQRSWSVRFFAGKRPGSEEANWESGSPSRDPVGLTGWWWLGREARGFLWWEQCGINRRNNGNMMVIWLVTGTWLDYDFPFLMWEESSQLLLTPSFFRGVVLPSTRLLLTIINHIVTIY